MAALGKILIVFGIVIVLAGVGLLFAHKIPYIGRLPGDIYIKKDGLSFYFPLTTSVLISVLISLIFWIFRK